MLAATPDGRLLYQLFMVALLELKLGDFLSQNWGHALPALNVREVIQEVQNVGAAL